MPVSHFGLAVSHIPSATSFYLAALQPLGYHYIGEQGNSIGLGIQDADFFISQAPRGTRPSPTHIAFAADNRLQVRDCYAGAINASGRPSGAPSYRNNDCSCFNAAVEDLDGNTIEFIYREGGICDDDRSVVAPSEHSRVLTWQKDVSHEANDGIPSQSSFDSLASTAKSRARTALDLASSTSKSMLKPSEASMTEIPRNVPTHSSGISSQAIIGTVLGAAAGAAIAYAMRRSEQDSAQEEAAYEASLASRETDRARSTRTATRAPTARRSASAAPPSTHRNFSVTESMPARSHRNFSVTDSRVSARPPPTLPPTVIKAIEPRGYDDSEVQAAISRHISRRPGTHRSKTLDAIEYAPVSTAGRSKYTAPRSATFHEEPQEIEGREQLMLEGPRSTISQYSRRDSKLEDSGLRRHDSGVSMHSQRSSMHSRKDDDDRRSSTSKTSTLKPSKRDSGYEESHHFGTRYEGSRHESRRAGDSGSQASTIKAPPRSMSRYDSAAGVPIPSSRADSHYSETRSRARSSSRAPSRVTGAEVRLPDSKVASYVSVPERSRAGSRAPTQHGSVHYAHPASKADSERNPSSSLAVDEMRDYAGDESDGMGDIKTVVPDDSISCIDYTKLRAPSSEASRHSARSQKSHHTGQSKHSRHVEESDQRSHHTSHSRRTQRLDEDDDAGKMDDSRTVLPEDSISSVGMTRPQPAGSEHSRHSERSHRSHHTSRSKHSRLPEENEDKRSHHTAHATRSKRPEEDEDKRSHHTSGSKSSRRPEEDQDKRSHHTSHSKRSHRTAPALEDPSRIDDSATVLPSDSISAAGVKLPEPSRSEYSRHSNSAAGVQLPEATRSEYSRHTERSNRTFHTSRSKHSQRPAEDPSLTVTVTEELPEPEQEACDIVPDDSISCAPPAAPRSEHSHHSERPKSHHSSRSKTSRRGEEAKEEGKADKARSDAARSTSTVKRVGKRRDSVATLPARLREKEREGKSGKKSNVSYAG